jgi:hypothetical protein
VIGRKIIRQNARLNEVLPHGIQKKEAAACGTGTLFYLAFTIYLKA